MGAIPLTEQSVTNQVVNYAEKLSYRDIINVKSHGDILSQKKLATFSKKSDVIIAQGTKQVETQFKKNSVPSDEKTINIITISTGRVTDLKDSICEEYRASMFTYGANLATNFTTAVNDYTNTLIAQMNLPSGSGIIDNIKNAAANAINSLISKLMSTINTIWEKFVVDITKILNQKIALINGFINTFNNLLASSLAVLNKTKAVANNFYERFKGEASTSKYIQANVPDVTGAVKANVKVLATTPDAKIITPQLKSDINKVKTFASNPLAALLGFVGSLIPSISSKKIEEPKPTGDKAEYGKIQVKEMQGGSVKIQDQTPGNVRDIDLHPSGSYTAKIPNKENPNLGDSNTKTTGDKQEITDGNWNITTSKDKVEIVVGENKIEIRKNDIQNITGNRDINIGAKCNTVVGQDVTDDFKNNYTGKIASNYSESIGGNKTSTIGGNLKETVTGNHNEMIAGGLTIQVTGNVNISAGGVTNISAKAACNITAGGIVKITGSKVLIG